jgi:hypothetical protein
MLSEVDHSDDWIVCFTAAVSHICMYPALRLLYQRRWMFELCVSAFAVWVSFMYHFCQAFHIRVFLSEGAWHRLDNVGVLSAFGIFFTHLCCFRDAHLDGLIRFAAIGVALLAQEKDPWNVTYTVVPVAAWISLPFILYGVSLQLPPWDWKECIYGFGLLAIAIPFFIMGLDDPNDPYRIYHGLWHVFSQLASWRLWKIVNTHPAYGSNLPGTPALKRPV